MASITIMRLALFNESLLLPLEIYYHELDAFAMHAQALGVETYSALRDMGK